MDKLLNEANKASRVMSEPLIRFSKDSDKEKIMELLYTCFGDREHDGAYNPIAGRYLLCFVEDKLVAMTGLIHNAEYNSGCEISWTCTHPEYRHQGLMIKLFERIINTTDEDIYCSCWKIPSKEHVNLHHLMDNFDFKPVIEGHTKNKYPYKCMVGNTCPFFTGEGCYCQQDLYVRKGKRTS